MPEGGSHENMRLGPQSRSSQSETCNGEVDGVVGPAATPPAMPPATICDNGE
jgi:hypothetical protein